ncbi:uncharacterized protein LOC130082385 [Rhinichthys klamathensis goyatoka]|uniref:uncharacterized protein LOC130082385 n=1 Tax=Rhinichthys klamathensis goyatoka TaxID=3034132 RepID=UPI0024B53330|nr:uncharacterized protein LOC130082385 [Rhinichthys klamathensis goyatoka]
MVKDTLNELSQLKQSGFGQPWPPRHGLNLLYWFAHEYIGFINYGEIVLRFKPKKGDFGFHKYHNRIDEEDPIVPIVPQENLLYYEVGNLNFPGADDLPDYVRANYRRNNPIPDSNKDRVIVRLDVNGSLNRVYVTEHSDPKSFDSSKTFRVSQGLLQIIKNMSRDQYLSQLSSTPEKQVGFRHTPGEQAGFRHTPGEQVGFRHTPQSHYNPPPNNDSWCTIL